MPFKVRLDPFNLRDPRNYRLYLSGVLIEVLAVFLLMGIGLLIVWTIPKLIH
jgi:hypothetical protein